MNEDIMTQVKMFIEGELLSEDEAPEPQTPLFSSRVINSRNLMDLVQFVEETFAIRVDPMELVFENFDTLERIAAYIQRKKG